MSLISWRAVFFAAILLFSTCLFARTVHVPSEAPTIQAGLDSLQDGDTVSIALGTYTEVLSAPAISFTLRGDVTPDTGNYARPVVSSGDDQTCWLALPLGSHPVVEDIKVYGGRGIRSWAADPILRRMVMDSVRQGFEDSSDAPGVISVESCHFRRSLYGSIMTLQGTLLASDCDFIQNSGDAVWAWSHSRISRCRFTDELASCNYLLLVSGDDVIVEDCQFGPNLRVRDNGKLSVVLPINVTVRNCLFVDCGTSDDVLDVIFQPRGEVHLLGNTVIDCESAYWGAIYISHSQSADTGSHVFMSDNVFDSCTVWNVWPVGDAITSYEPIRFERNRFLRMSGSSWSPALWLGVVSDSNGDSYELNQNIFENTGWALWSESLAPPNARFNWWGDSTGPYHAAQNPTGQGDSIVGNVDFTPWYPDTSFLSVPGLGKPLPKEFTFEAYPNPFNSSVHLRLIPNDIQIVRVELFDLLGRRVKDIWHGLLAYQKDIEFDATNLASGVYFARVTNSIYNRQLAMQKLVLLK